MRPFRLSPVIALLALALCATSGTALFYRHQLQRVREQPATPPLHRARPSAPRPVVTPAVAPSMVHEDVEQPAEEEDTSDLLRRIDELSAALRAKEEWALMLQAQATNAPSEEAVRPPDRRAWMEDLKENDPKAYEEMLARREEARQRLNDALARKSAFFLDRDTSSLTAEEKEQYAYMLDLLDETWRMAERSQNEELPRDERHQARRTVFRNARELAPMLEVEREVELFNLGRSVGYSEQEAEEFTAYVEELIELTTMNSMFENMFRGRGRGPGGGGPPDGPGRP